MKSLFCMYLLLVITFFIYGCEPATPSAISTQTESRIPSLTVFPSAIGSISTSTETLTPTSQTPTPTLMLTPPIPLGSEEAKATIRASLHEPVDCAAPCFWGIVPGRTTLGEAWNIFTLLGIQHLNTTYTVPEYKGMRLATAQYDFLSVQITLVMRDDVVMNLLARMTPEVQKAGISREWLSYSPETLINRYGLPSQVILVLDRGPNLFFEMDIYFDEFDLIVAYLGNHVISEEVGELEVCPLVAQFDMVALWMGKDPIDLPLHGVPLEKATGMTVEEFSQLMTGDPDQACFILNDKEFIP
jgi:hypothetical protein